MHNLREIEATKNYKQLKPYMNWNVRFFTFRHIRYRTNILIFVYTI